jgi:PBSX family phage terminase large subunit
MNRSQQNYSGLPEYLLQAKLEIARRKSEMLSARDMTNRAWELRGNNLAAQTNYDPELVLVGAAGTGKTLGNLVYINRQMWNYPRLRTLVARKVRADLAESVLVTFERDILGYDNPICAGVQREHRQAYRYPNGSIMVLAGMDRPGKVLSSEWDIIYVPEGTQLDQNDWETLGMRLARTGNFPFPQLRSDTNPDRPDHWMKQRADAGILTMLNTFHRDNPAFWDETTDDWTELGRRYVLGQLSRLTGVRRLRYLEGKWVIAEGAIYEDWDESIHVIDTMPDGWESWKKIRAVDFGYTNPFVCQWWAISHDGEMYLYREIYKTRRLVEDHARDILRYSAGEQIAYTVADHDAEDRATLERHGVKTIGAKKSVSVGIQTLQARFRVGENKKPRIFIKRDALVEIDYDLKEKKLPTCTREEIPGYVWADKSRKEEPVKEHDHGCDTARYAAMAVESRGEVKMSERNPFFD